MSTETGLRPIETIRPGDRVWAFNHRVNEWQLKLVLANFERPCDTDLVHVTVGGETIQATMLHPFWVISGKDLSERPVRSHLEKPPEDSKVPGRWVDATDLRPGDQFLRQDGTEPVITHVEHKPANTTVYNFSVDELRCYAVGQTRILVHNSNGLEDLIPNTNAPASTFHRLEHRSLQSQAKIKSLAADMKANGWRGDPVSVFEFGNEKYILDGHHRVAAARQAEINVPFRSIDASKLSLFGYKNIEAILIAASEAFGK